METKKRQKPSYLFSQLIGCLKEDERTLFEEEIVLHEDQQILNVFFRLKALDFRPFFFHEVEPFIKNPDYLGRYLNKLNEKIVSFMVNLELESDPISQDLLLLKFLNRRNKGKTFERFMRKAVVKIDKEGRGGYHHKAKFALLELYQGFLSKNNHTAPRHVFDEIEQALKNRFESEKKRFEVIRSNFDRIYADSPKVKKLSLGAPLETRPKTPAIYAKVQAYLETGDNSQINQVLADCARYFSYSEQAELVGWVINEHLRRFSASGQLADGEALYKVFGHCLEFGLIVIDGKIPGIYLKNLFEGGFRVASVAEVDSVVKPLFRNVRASERSRLQNYYHLVRLFFEHDYAKALSHRKKCNFQNPYLRFHADLLELKALYEMYWIEGREDVTIGKDLFDILILVRYKARLVYQSARNHDIIKSYHRKGIIHFVSYYRQILTPFSSKEEKEKLEKIWRKISLELYVDDKWWLRKMIEFRIELSEK